ncbi:hypothetical protein FQA39_LY05788 [Lamprigera yunnana]|nr:hypothetical protein FQA39_LY05788 [Lamprigera yunnana]
MPETRSVNKSEDRDDQLIQRAIEKTLKNKDFMHQIVTKVTELVKQQFQSNKLTPKCRTFVGKKDNVLECISKGKKNYNQGRFDEDEITTNSQCQVKNNELWTNNGKIFIKFKGAIHKF